VSIKYKFDVYELKNLLRRCYSKIDDMSTKIYGEKETEERKMFEK
jgi:hypothetical protein